MHPLTKMFIVLQALLSVLVAALVIPFAVNEDNWKTRYESQAAEITAATEAARQAETALGNERSQREAERSDLLAQLANEQERAETLRRELLQLRTERDEAVHEAAQIRGEIMTLTSTTDTQSKIIDTQAQEISSRREESLRLKQRSIDLEDQLRDVSSQLEVAVDAQRLLQERIERLNEQLEGGATMTAGANQGQDTAPIPSPAIMGRVIRTSNTASGDTFAEIDLGSRDGVRENMEFLISRDGEYLATLVISQVDINRASGRLRLQTASVSQNDRVSGGVN